MLQDGLRKMFFNEESNGVLRFNRFLMVQKLWALKHWKNGSGIKNAFAPPEQ